jgi:hypothetical protein
MLARLLRTRTFARESSLGRPVTSTYAYADNRPSVMVDPSGQTSHPAGDANRFVALATSTSTGPGFVITGTLRTRACQAYYYFLVNGLSTIQAASIVGNLIVESKYTLNPRILQQNCSGPGCGIGIAQWDNRDRWPKFVTWATQTSWPGAQWSYMVQVTYVLYELTHDYPTTFNRLVNAGTLNGPTAATSIVMNDYEGAGDKGSIGRRETAAKWCAAACGS